MKITLESNDAEEIYAALKALLDAGISFDDVEITPTIKNPGFEIPFAKRA